MYCLRCTGNSSCGCVGIFLGGYEVKVFCVRDQGKKLFLECSAVVLFVQNQFQLCPTETKIEPTESNESTTIDSFSRNILYMSKSWRWRCLVGSAEPCTKNVELSLAVSSTARSPKSRVGRKLLPSLRTSEFFISMDLQNFWTKPFSDTTSCRSLSHVSRIDAHEQFCVFCFLPSRLSKNGCQLQRRTYHGGAVERRTR